MHHKNNDSNSQGNVLFLILIAVALLAALSYAVTSSSKGGGSGISNDKAKIAASTFFQFATEMEASITRHTLLNRTSWSQIQYAGNNTNCSSTSCQLDHPNGGNASYDLPKMIFMPEASASFQKARFQFIKVEGVGSDLPELALYTPGISLKTCQAINKKMEITLTASYYPGLPSANLNTGSLQLSSATYNAQDLDTLTMSNNPKNFRLYEFGIVGSGPELAGHRTFCTCIHPQCDGGAGGYWMAAWHVLVAR